MAKNTLNKPITTEIRHEHKNIPFNEAFLKNNRVVSYT